MFWFLYETHFIQAPKKNLKTIIIFLYKIDTESLFNKSILILIGNDRY